MTTDELIAKLLDGTLSANEQLHLNSLMASSPELAEEVHSLTTIEQLLRSQPQPLITEESEAFLHTVENRIATAVSSQRKATVIGTKAAAWLVAIPLAVLLGGMSISLLQPSATQTNETQRVEATPPALQIEVPVSFHAPVSTPTSQSNNQVSTAQQTEIKSQRHSTEQQEANTNELFASANEQPATNSETAHADIQGNANIANQQNTNNYIESYRKQFEQFLQDGNRAQAAITAKTIGVLHRQSGNTTEAQHFLLLALKLSREVHLVEYEAEALGELGLTAKAKGNADEARTYLRSCVTLLENGPNTALLSRWQKESRNIE